MTVRTRFAPSPTGYLHIGGARTALFNYLFARQARGVFILRIEDTDVERSTPEYVDAILDGMKWLGLEWDEGPYFQSKRFALHREAALTLLEKGLAYRCYCTPEELEERRQAALREGKTPRYDGRCRNITEIRRKPFAARFKVNPGKTVIEDLIKGPVIFDHEELEDLVLLRSDSTPTYNLCVVVDDADMKITHVIRGDDHIANTPKQVLLYEALGFTVPEFAHLPMILGSDKTRLSKRHGATSVGAYREMGCLPKALLNYLARLGWSYGDEEIFSVEELIEKFSFEHVGRSAGVFNPEKLLWLNQHYIKESKPEELAALLSPFLKELAAGDERLPLIVKTVRERARTLKEMAEYTLFYFKEPQYQEGVARKFLTPEKAEPLRSLIERLSAAAPFSAQNIENAFTALLSERGLPLGALAQPVRVALTGATVSPGIYETIEALGKERTIKRLERAVDFIKTRREAAPG
jgi:glutamyl-tRNA synthetase